MGSAAGYRVVGAAVKGEATRTLAAATGIECETVAWYLAHTDPQANPLDSRTILVVDEASTLSDRDLDALMTMAATTGATLRLIGDPAQHGAIAAGGMFRVLCERHPLAHPRADHHPPAPGPPRPRRRPSASRRPYRRSLRPARSRRAPPRRRRRPHHVPRMSSADGGTPTETGIDHPMVDRRNSTRRQLNRLAHLLRQVNGELGTDEIAASGDRAFSRRRPRHRPRPEPRPPRRRRPPGLRPQRRARHHHRRPPRPDHRRDDTHHRRLRRDRPHRHPPQLLRPPPHRRRATPRSASTTPTRSPATPSKAPPATSPPAVSTPPPPAPRPTSTSPAAATRTTSTSPPPPTHSTAKPSPSVPPPPADLAVAERLHRSTGELTAWELAQRQQAADPIDRGIGL